ncbi:MAG TPA: Ku protein, partial [Verrucomicrobiae bacterium]|nr:Ku protein [Verrucomicrobiae bacterium]
KIPASLDVGTRELEMATDLVERMTDAWDPEKYTDDYRSALMNLIQQKVEHGGRTPPDSGPKKKRPANVVDLVSVLQESLAQTEDVAARKSEKSSAHKHRPKEAA